MTRRFIESLSTHLEDHLATWKSSLVDARRDVEKLLTTASERIPAQARPLFPEDLMAMMLEDVLPPPAAPPPPEKVVERVVVPGPPSPPDWGTVRAALAAVESARTQVDVLTRFLTQANAHASRVALLVLRNDRLTGWKAIGYDASGGRDDAAKTVDLAADADPYAAEVLKRERSMLAEPPDEDSPLRRALGGRAPVRAVLVPMVIRDRLAGLLLAEELSGEEGRLNEAALEVLTFTTGLAVDLLAARKKIPSPTLTPLGEPLARYAPPRATPPDSGATLRAPSASLFPAPAPVEAPEAAPRAAPVEAPEQVDGGGRRRITDAEEAIRALEESAAHREGRKREAPPSTPRPIPRSSFEELARPSTRSAPPPVAPIPTGEVTLAFEHLKTGAPPMAEPAPPPPLKEAPKPVTAPSPIQEALSSGSAQPLAPPPGFVPRSRLGRVDDQQRALDDAKRLARLLVSEIKLYNERKVEEGRAAGDLYERLKDDIQRSRQVYDERTPESIRAGTDFFRDELVRILAEGRAEALGPMA